MLGGAILNPAMLLVASWRRTLILFLWKDPLCLSAERAVRLPQRQGGRAPQPCQRVRSRFVGGLLVQLSAWLLLPLLSVSFPVFFPASFSAHAEGLQSYVASLGSPSAVRVLEHDDAGPTRVAFKSQVWRGVPWSHEIIVKAPRNLKRRDLVVVLLTGGDGGSEQVRSAQYVANALGVRVAVLTRVPNQPLFGDKREDVLLSFSLDQYRRSADASWPLLFPMVASVVKGIDTLEQVLDERSLQVVLIGASKRGWTTYLTAALDSRIVAMVPAVFEMISMQEQIALMRRRYGRDSEKIRPYTALGLTDSLRDPLVAKLISWIDPIEYFPRYTMPKLVLLGANDPYWVVDSVRRYWDSLPGPKLLRILPNVGHGVLAEPGAREAIVSFVSAVMGKIPLPRLEWHYSARADNRAIVSGESDTTIKSCTVWRAGAAIADLRQARFSSTACQILDGGKRFQGAIELPEQEHTAVFVDLGLSTGVTGTELLASTETQVYGPVDIRRW